MIRILNVKVYDLETLTQEDLNNLALERNTLAKENQRLNNKIHDITETLNETYNNRTELRNENDRLNNIINKLEKYLKKRKKKLDTNVVLDRYARLEIKDTLDKLQELKEGK